MMAHHERLTRLSDLLDNYHGLTKFNIGTFFEESNCGTAACACGLAALNPWFQQQGFRLHPLTQHCERIPTFEGLIGWPAVHKFFQVSGIDANHLFLGNSYSPVPYREVTPDMVSKRIKAFVASNIEKYGE